MIFLRTKRAFEMKYKTWKNLVSKVLSFTLKQTSKDLADTIFKVLSSRTFTRLGYLCWKLISSKNVVFKAKFKKFSSQGNAAFRPGDIQTFYIFIQLFHQLHHQPLWLHGENLDARQSTYYLNIYFEFQIIFTCNYANL